MITISNKITLFGKSSTGKIKVWSGWIESQDDKSADIVVEHGYIDGKKQQAVKHIRSGKNIGKSNETSPLMQAWSELDSTAEKKRDEGYRKDLQDCNENKIILPMLAQSYLKHPDRLKYPAYVQRKLDGVRCLAEVMPNNTVKFTSRKNKPFTTLDIFSKQILEKCPVGTILDGELYNPNLPLNQIVSRIKRVLTSRENISDNPIQFHIYDFVRLDVPYYERFEELNKWFGSSTENIHLVETIKVNSYDEIQEFHIQAVEQGYEGSMLRNKDGLYKVDYRSYDLLKLKDYFEEEFIITGGYCGVGKEENQIIFTCATKLGAEFNVRPKGDAATRTRWFKDKENLIGKYLTVRYQNLTEYKVPFHARGICVRNYE
jgi:DNA ligase-1